MPRKRFGDGWSLAPGCVAVLPRDAFEDDEDCYMLVLETLPEGLRVLVLDGRVLNAGPGGTRVLRGLVSVIRPL